jgi:hypothetical protein
MASRQEVLNVILAQLLKERGLVAAPEEILQRPTRERRLPDVIVDFQGLRLAIEAEFGAQNRRIAWEKACKRVQEAIAHIGVAVVYPTRLKTVAFDRLNSELQRCTLQFAVFTEANEPDGQRLLFKREVEPSFSRGTVDDLGNAIRRSYDQLVRDDTLGRAVQLLETVIGSFMAALESQPATTGRLTRTLGIEQISENNPRARRAVSRIAGLILCNAMIFQEVLSKADARVFPLRHFRGNPNIIDSMGDHWDFILNDINYYPIFKTAFELIKCLSADLVVSQTYGELLDTSLDIVGCRASLRHDLAGRIYHRLLEEAKYLGAYYTSIPSATLLLKLAISSASDPVDGGDATQIPDLRVADLACGTGTLLMAAGDALMDKYLRECAESGTPPQLQEFHTALVERMVHGYDVLPSAIHLTASTLALRVPDTPVNVTHLYSVPLGGQGLHLGTLDLLEEEHVGGTLFGQTEQITGRGRRAGVMVTIPPLDVCVMNPPFTRSVGGNLLFGNLPNEERRPMQERLKSIVRSRKVRANITAGLGAVFVALADRYLKPGGTMALVLPRALVSGVAWQPTRELLNEKYDVAYVIVSHEPEHWNFSENTSLSEVLVVARKRNNGNCVGPSKKTTFVSLWRQPQNSVEALSLASSLISDVDVLQDDALRRIDARIGGHKAGEGVVCSTSELSPQSWGTFCAFAQSELVVMLHRLVGGELHLPGRGQIGHLPLCRLDVFGKLGFDRRDMHDGFSVVTNRTVYPSIWGHDASVIVKMQQNPNAWLEGLDRAREGRPLREPEHLWEKASRVLIAERLRLNTTRLACIRVSEPVLANVWWPLCLGDEHLSQDTEKSIVLWLNSSLGLLLLLGYRVETEGAWIDLKKPILERLPVLDFRTLSEDALREFGRAYDDLSESRLEPISEMGRDETRARIDGTISQILGIPDLIVLRELMSREPTLCLTRDRLVEPQDTQQ